MTSKRELNQHTASVLAKVTADSDVVVTERGHPKWRITTFDHHDTPLDRLAFVGGYTPPAESPSPWAEPPGGPAYTDAQVDELIAELRGDH